VKYTDCAVTAWPIARSAATCRASCMRIGSVTSARRRTGVALYSTTSTVLSDDRLSVSQRPR